MDERVWSSGALGVRSCDNLAKKPVVRRGFFINQAATGFHETAATLDESQSTK